VDRWRLREHHLRFLYLVHKRRHGAQLLNVA
jgi:hypothetical protein